MPCLLVAISVLPFQVGTNPFALSDDRWKYAGNRRACWFVVLTTRLKLPEDSPSFEEVTNELWAQQLLLSFARMWTLEALLLKHLSNVSSAHGSGEFPDANYQWPRLIRLEHTAAISFFWMKLKPERIILRGL